LYSTSELLHVPVTLLLYVWLVVITGLEPVIVWI
jgi:hypothetical protein